MDCLTISALELDCIIGDEPWERETPQRIRCDLQLGYDLRRAGESDRLSDTIDYAAVGRAVAAYIQASRCYLLEALAAGVAREVLRAFAITQITVTLRKAAHFPHAEAVAVTITRVANGAL